MVASVHPDIQLTRILSERFEKVEGTEESGTEMPTLSRDGKGGMDRKSESGGRGGSTELAEHLKAPPDTNNFAYNIMFWQGVGQLFPWNAFITAAAYFGARFCTTDVANDFENYFSISFTAFQTAGLGLSVFYGNKFSLHDKIVYPLVCYSVLFALTTALVLVKNIDGYLLFWVTFISCSANGLVGSILSAGLFSLGGCLPPAYTAALMSGQGLAGLSVAVAGIVTQAAGPEPDGWCAPKEGSTGDDTDSVQCSTYSISYSALSYFLIATIVLGSCAVLFYVLVKLPFTEWHTRLAGVDIYTQETQENIKEPLLTVGDLENSDHSLKEASINFGEGNFSKLEDEDYGDGGFSQTDMQSSAGSTALNRNANPLTRAAGGGGSDYSSLDGDDARNDSGNKSVKSDVKSFKESKLLTNEVDTDDGAIEKSLGMISLAEVMVVLRVIKIPAFTVFMVFVTTICLFPATIVFLLSEHHCDTDERFFNDLFVPFFFVLFNLGDFLGRVIAGYFTPVFTPKNIWIVGCSRLVFIPLFLLCNLSNSQLPVVFISDAWPVIFMIFFALSNGYVSSTCMQMGPAMVPSSDAPLAGTIMIFCLTAGLMGGAVVSFPVTVISQGHVGNG